KRVSSGIVTFRAISTSSSAAQDEEGHDRRTGGKRGRKGEGEGERERGREGESGGGGAQAEEGREEEEEEQRSAKKRSTDCQGQRLQRREVSSCTWPSR